MLDTDLDAIEALAARLRQPAIEFRARTLRTAQTLISGRLDDAEQQIAALGDYVAAHGLTQPGTIGVLTFRLHYERGRLADFEPFLLQLVADQASIVTWRVALISVYASTDRLDDAREHLHMLAADDFAIIPRDVLWVVSIAGIARIAGLAGELDIAQRAYDYMLPFRGVTAVTGQSAEQPVALSIGTAAAALGRFDDAEQHYAEAIDLAQRLGAPTFVAATRVQWAQTLLDPRGPHDVTRAKELAQQALATAEELGLGRVSELSRRVLST